MQGIFISLFLLLGTIAHTKAPLTDWEYYQKSGDKSAKWDPLVEAGFQAFDGQNYSAALSFLKRAMGLGCKDGLVIYRLAVYKELLGDFLQAIDGLKKAEPFLLKNYSGHAAAREWNDHLGGLYYQTEKYDEALAQYLASIQNQGENFLRDYLVGQIYRMKKNSSEAISYFEKSLGFEPPAGSPANIKLLAKVELLKLYFDAGKNDPALAMANQVLAEDPANPTALAIRSRLYQRGIKEKEREEWKKILEKY